MTFKKISASLALLLASATITACGGNNETTADCADGEIKAQIGEGDAQCYKTCTSDDDCGTGESCTGGGSSKVCVADGGSNPDPDMDTTPDPDMDTTPDPDMDTTPDPDMDTTPDPDMDTTPDMDDMNGGSAPNTGESCAEDATCTGTMGACLTSIEGQDFPEGYCVSSCTSDANCGAGNVCLQGSQSGLCLAGCTSDANCRTGYTCQSQGGAQVCLPAPPDFIVGVACEVAGGGNEMCGGGFCASEAEFGFTDGFCVAPCTNGNDGTCPDNAQCVADVFGWTDQNGMETGQGTCLPSCTSSSECRTGYACTDLDQDGRGECFPTNTEGDAPGSACTPPDANGMNGTECIGISGQCLPEDNGFPGGSCVSFCDFTGECPTGSHCDDTIFSVAVCVPDCTDDSSCRDEYSCLDAGQDSTNECFPAPVSADGTGVPGDACVDTSTDCAGGALGFCITEAQGFVGGYCSVDCTMDDSVCVAGSSCKSLGQTQSICLDDCMTSNDCRGAGYACLDLDNGGVAVNTPGSCFSVDNCDPQNPCEGSSNFCVDTNTGNFGDTGACVALAPCSADNACPTDASCFDPDTVMLGDEGICLSNCVAGQTDCTADFVCAKTTAQGLVAAGQGEAGFCIPQ